ncbi:MAG: hypothetical protein JJV97_03065 [SAR324 cluster bacterium]|nr:hypothetical protein [SAR324 cluster bacterium]
MNRLAEMRELLENASFGFSLRTRNIFYLLMAVGGLVFLANLFLGDPQVAWQSLLINVVFFAGIAQATLMFSVISTVTDAFWVRPIKRVAEVISTFGLLSMGLFIFLFLGGKYLFQWYNHDLVIHAKEGWLNYNFFIIRQLVGLAVLAVLSLLYLRNSIRPDFSVAKKLGISFSGTLYKRCIKDHKDHELEAEKSYHSNKQLAPWLGFVFGGVASLVAFDWMMSIDQEWFSTMFGVQYVVSSLIGGGSVLIIVSGFMRGNEKIAHYQTKYRHHDITKLTFAFVLLWTYMIFSQVLVIWYADIPEETPYMILRMKSEEWGWMFFVIFIVVFVIPFFGLMSRTACRSILFSRIMAIDLLIGLWLEKYFIIVPSMQENALDAQLAKGSSLGAHITDGSISIPGFMVMPFLANIMVGLGILGMFLLWVNYFAKKVPMMPIGDNRLVKQDH